MEPTDFNLFLDATESGSVTESGGLVSQWSDISGNGNHFMQSTESAKPTFGDGIINFDGNDLLHGPIILPETTDWVVAARYVSDGTRFQSVFGQTRGFPNFDGMHIGQANGSNTMLEVFPDPVSGATSARMALSSTLGVFNTGIAWRSGNVLRFKTDKFGPVVKDEGSTQRHIPQVIARVGSRGSGNRWNGGIVRVGIWLGTPTSQDLKEIEALVTGIKGIPVPLQQGFL